VSQHEGGFVILDHVGLLVALGSVAAFPGPVANLATSPTLVLAMTRWPSTISIRIGARTSLLPTAFLATISRATATGATTSKIVATATPVRLLLLITVIPIADTDSIILDGLQSHCNLVHRQRQVGMATGWVRVG
jgi:hypothetical protein